MSDRDDHIVSRIMDKAATADRRALFAAVQASVSTIVDLYWGTPRPHGPEIDEFLRRTEKALDIGAPYGSPEQIRAVSGDQEGTSG